jgi:hypothetical protein
MTLMEVSKIGEQTKLTVSPEEGFSLPLKFLKGRFRLVTNS